MSDSKLPEGRKKLDDKWFLEKAKVFGQSPVFDELSRLSQEQENFEKSYEEKSKELWDDFSEADQLKLFYWVVKNITEGELIDKGSYRWILYEKFGFSEKSYGVGITCGFMQLHNSINHEDGDS